MGNLETRGPYPNTLSLADILYVDKVGGTTTEDGYVTVEELKDVINEQIQRLVDTDAPTAILKADGVILFDTTTATINIDLPLASIGKVIIPFKDIGANSSVNNITINKAGSDTIVDSAIAQSSTVIVSNGFSGNFLSNGVDTWYLL